MNESKKKNGLYLVAFASILLATLSVYSCSADEYGYANESESETSGFVQTRTFSAGVESGENTLIDSVAASNEFWEFTMNNQLLAEKFGAYVSTLSEQEYDKLMSDLNNDEFTEEFIEKANLKKELKQVNIAGENLFQHTGFLRLNENERNQLFSMSSEKMELTKPAILKTREEGGGTDKCEEQKQEAYKQANANYNHAIAKCTEESPSSTCSALAAARQEREQRKANNEYAECIKR